MPADKKPLFEIVASPTFEATAEVPTPGGEPRPLRLVFKHKTRDDASAFMERKPQEGDTDGSVLDEIVADWKNVKEKYSAENMTTLCQNFPGAPEAIILAYYTELGLMRRKN